MLRTLSIIAVLATPAAADLHQGIAQLEVLPGWQTPDGSQMAGLRITLAPGWKTYWRAPGDAGIPPQITLNGSENLGTAQIMWPVPEVFDQAGMRSIGYHDSVVIPLQVAPDGDGPLRLSGQIDIGVCEEICVPVQLDFDAVLPPSDVRDPAIVASLMNRPLSAQEAGAVATCAIGPNDVGLQVTVELTLPDTGGSEVVVIEAGDPQVWVSEADVTRSGNTLTATSDMVHMVQDTFAVDRSQMRITVLGETQAVDVRGCQAG